MLIPKDPLKSSCYLFGGDGHWSLGFLHKARVAIYSHTGHIMHLVVLWGKWKKQAHPAPKIVHLGL